VSPFRWASRVYWEDTDGGGIVYYGNYLRFLERARTEWLRSLGFSQLKLAEESGVLFAVVSLNIEYRRPAKLDDELIITCEPAIEGSASVRFVQRIYRGADELLVEASVRVACIDARTLRPKRPPDFLTNAGGALPNG
jgi:acyl-CoA thioester hydrolase